MIGRDTTRLVGLGCMRLSSPMSADEDRTIATFHAALDAGVTLLDTADAYGPGLAAWGEMAARFAELAGRLGLDDIAFCPHAAGPPVCWCRKPLPGLGALLIRRHRLDPPSCRFIGNGPADRAFAGRLGFAWSSSI